MLIKRWVVFLLLNIKEVTGKRGGKKKDGLAFSQHGLGVSSLPYSRFTMQYKTTTYHSRLSPSCLKVASVLHALPPKKRTRREKWAVVWKLLFKMVHLYIQIVHILCVRFNFHCTIFFWRVTLKLLQHWS